MCILSIVIYISGSGQDISNTCTVLITPLITVGHELVICW